MAVDQPAIRLGLRLVRGLAESDARAVVDAVRHGTRPRSLSELHHHRRIPIGVLRRLARADAFRSLGLDRQRALWELQRLRDEALPLLDDLVAEDATARRATSDNARCHGRIDVDDGDGGASDSASGIAEPEAVLPPISRLRSISDDYESLELSLDRHPVGCLRAELDRRGIRPAVLLDDPRATPDGCRFGVAGVVLVRQRPSTAGGIVFMTLEDETGIANLVLKPKIYRRHRSIARHAVAMVAFGRVERRGEVVHLVVGRVERISTPILERDRIAGRPSMPPDQETCPRERTSLPDGPSPLEPEWRVRSRSFH